MASREPIYTLRQAFQIHPGEVISLVGAGGKTTLMFALSQELISPKKLVITTTTTKILAPSPSQSPHMMISREEKEIIDFILKNGTRLSHISVASEQLEASGKLQGIRSELVLQLIKLDPVSYIIVEADGAAHRSLKAPDLAFEPVIPPNTSMIIPVIGIDALGCELAEEYVFRSKIAAQLTGRALGEIVSADTIAILMTHPLGIISGTPVHARIIPFINKIDLLPDLSKARDLASRILEENHPQIDRVVLGQAQLNPPVVEVVFNR
jgi:probable selenium-dependent hydroxylase accessory protein YqeC